jgi:hypothetical protein
LLYPIVLINLKVFQGQGYEEKRKKENINKMMDKKMFEIFDV